LGSLNQKRGNCSSTTVGDKIFAFGGFNEDQSYLNSTELYDLNNGLDTEDDDILCWYEKTNKGKWVNLANMKYQKCSAGIKYYAVNEEIILIGGHRQDYHNDNESKSFLMFNIVKNDYFEYPKTAQQHSWKPAVAVENGKTIYVIGNDGRQNDKWGTIEQFDIRENKWSPYDELTKSTEISNKDAQKRLFQCVLNC